MRTRRTGTSSGGRSTTQSTTFKRDEIERRRIELDVVDCAIDGLKVKRVGETTLEIVRKFVDEIVTLPDPAIFAALLWTLSRTKIVVEGAAAAPVAALLNGWSSSPPARTSSACSAVGTSTSNSSRV